MTTQTACCAADEVVQAAERRNTGTHSRFIDGTVLEDGFQLDEAVAPLGLFYPPDPSSGPVCTIGGNVAMNAGGAKLPWPLSFSYGRALQAPALKAWKGQAGNVSTAQKALMHRSKLNSAAATGRYKAEMEKQAA